jgi:glycine/D-amino acid oxidase-like deaminating enzyme
MHEQRFGGPHASLLVRRGSPTIGEIPGYAYCYAALGYHGNGITFSMLAASLLTDAIRANAIPTRAFSNSK